jgi:hypothetical protein
MVVFIDPYIRNFITNWLRLRLFATYSHNSTPWDCRLAWFT